jgi:hypothetical protein
MAYEDFDPNIQLADTPTYPAAKGVGLLGARTSASQLGAPPAAGYKGLGQGFGLALRRFMESLLPPSPIDRRGSDFGVPPAPAPAAVAPAPVQGFESEYERELRVLRGGQTSIGGTSIFTR